MHYIEDNKQKFEVIVVPRDLAEVVLKCALRSQWIRQNLHDYQKKLLLERSETRCATICQKMHHM